MLKKEVEDFIQDYVLYGFSSIQDYELLKGFNFENLVHAESVDQSDPIIEYSSEQLGYLNFVKDHIEKQYVKSLYNNCLCTSKNMWEGVEPMSMEWHNDFSADQDFSFLYYIDNTDTSSGGALHFKGNKEFSIYPKEATLVWMNQLPDYLHKAEKSINKRRIIHLGFKIL